MQGLRPFDSAQDKPRPLLRRFILSGRSRRADLFILTTIGTKGHGEALPEQGEDGPSVT
jgi:hypothetical protein